MNSKNESTQIHREVQRFRQFWVWLIVLIITLLVWYSMVSQLIFYIPFGSNPMPDLLLLLFWLLFGIGLPVFLFFCKLIIDVHSNGIYIKYIPFHRTYKKIAFHELEKYEVLTYRPIRDYGGWGIRYGLGGKRTM